MASLYWLGTLTAVAQVGGFTPANVEIGDTFTITLTAEDGTTSQVSFVATAGTVANVTAGLLAACQASTNVLFTSITWSDQTTYLRATATTAGQPFYATTSTTNGGASNTQTLTYATSVASAGPSDWNLGGNWSSGTKPANSDNVVIDENGAASIKYGLNQGSLTLASLRIKKGFTYEIGTAAYSLILGTTTLWTYGESGTSGIASNGSGRIKLAFGSSQYTGMVYETGSATPTDTGKAPLQITAGSHASSKLYVVGAGRVDVATGTGQTATLSEINVSGLSAVVSCGSGVTWTTATCSAGTLYLASSGTTLTVTTPGTVYTDGASATLTTLNVGGSAVISSRGTITTLNLWNTGRVDFSKNPNTLTVTTLNHYGGGILSFYPPTPSHLTISTYNKINAGTLTAS